MAIAGLGSSAPENFDANSWTLVRLVEALSQSWRLQKCHFYSEHCWMLLSYVIYENYYVKPIKQETDNMPWPL